MAVNRLAAVAALTSSLLLQEVSACSCAPSANLCDYIQRADVVLRASAVSRVEGASINDDAMYTLESIEVFKGDSSADSIYAAGETFDIIMAGNGALCGIFLQLEQELLIDLSEDDDGNLNGVGLCGLTSSWDAVTTEDMAVLEEGCDDYDPCDGACSEFQECEQFYGGEATYYCSASCELGPCGDDEVCSLSFPACTDYNEPCPAEANCTKGTATPAPMWEVVTTLPPGATVDSTTSSSDTPTPSPMADADKTEAPAWEVLLTLPPGASIDSTTSLNPPAPSQSSDTEAPSWEVLLTLPPDATTESTSSSETPSPVESGDMETPSPVTEVTRGIDATSSPTLRTAAPAAVQAIDTDAPTSAPTGGLGLEGNGATGLLSGLSVAGVVGTVVISAVFTGALQARMFV